MDKEAAMETSTDTFFKHLESCKRCANNPFDMCIIGQIWIQKAAKDAGSSTHKFVRDVMKIEGRDSQRG